MLPVARPRWLIGERQFIPGPITRFLDRVRIEVVVDVYTIDVIAPHHVSDHRKRAGSSLFFAGVHPEHVAISLHDLRMGIGNMLRCQW